MNEKRLVQVLMSSQVREGGIILFICWLLTYCVCQVAGSIVAFVVRYGLAGLVYDGDRR